MKKFIFSFIMASFFTFNLFAASSYINSEAKIKDVGEAVTAGLEFFKNENAALINDFKGVRASSEESGVLVKIYTNNSGNLDYHCHRQTNMAPFMCHEM